MASARKRTSRAKVKAKARRRKPTPRVMVSPAPPRPRLPPVDLDPFIKLDTAVQAVRAVAANDAVTEAKKTIDQMIGGEGWVLPEGGR